MRSQPNCLSALACTILWPIFANVLDPGGDLMLVSSQLRDAVMWAYNNASTFGGDRNRIYISCHSSGAHLASVVMVTDQGHDEMNALFEFLTTEPGICPTA